MAPEDNRREPLGQDRLAIPNLRQSLPILPNPKLLSASHLAFLDLVKGLPCYAHAGAEVIATRRSRRGHPPIHAPLLTASPE
jgi:hypothetical protein